MQLIQQNKQEGPMKKVGPERAKGALLAGLRAIVEAASDPTMPIQQAMTFLVVAQSSEVPQAELIRNVGLAPSSVSRNVARLAQGTLTEPGLYWIENYEDPAWRRRKLVRLTPRGKAVADRVSSAVLSVLQ